MSEKCLKNSAFSNIQNLFSEPVNTICFAIRHAWSNEINKYFKIYVEITVLYTTEMLLILQGKRRSIIPKFIIIIHGKCIRRKNDSEQLVNEEVIKVSIRNDIQITNGVRQHYPFLIFSLATIQRLVNCTQRFACHNLFDSNRHALVKRCGRFCCCCCFVWFFFSLKKKGLHQNKYV